MSPDFLTVDDVLMIHEDQIELFGGASGIRDHGLLESAIAQAQMSFGDTITETLKLEPRGEAVYGIGAIVRSISLIIMIPHRQGIIRSTLSLNSPIEDQP